MFFSKEKGVLENYYIIVPCGNQVYFYAFLALTIIYKLVLHAVGLVLAFFTRKIKVDVLNDYCYNTAIIIGSSMLLVVVGSILPPLFKYINLYDLVWGILTFLLISIYLGLTFIPKIGIIIDLCHAMWLL